MLDKLTKTTKNFTKLHGQIQCNRGEQEQQVKNIMVSKGYSITSIGTKPRKAQLIYDKI